MNLIKLCFIIQWILLIIVSFLFLYGIPRNIKAQFGDQGKATDIVQLGTAVTAFIFGILGQADGYAGLQFQSPVLTQPPGVAAKQATAVKISLHPVVPDFRIKVKGQGNIAHIVMGIYQVHPQEPGFIGLPGIPAEFRHNGKIAPVDCIYNIIVVPEQPAGPGLDAGIETQGNVLSQSHFKSKIGFGNAISKEISTKGYAPGGRIRFRGFFIRCTSPIAMLLGRSANAIYQAADDKQKDKKSVIPQNHIIPYNRISHRKSVG
jgi:hypothetical protein